MVFFGLGLVYIGIYSNYFLKKLKFVLKFYIIFITPLIMLRNIIVILILLLSFWSAYADPQFWLNNSIDTAGDNGSAATTGNAWTSGDLSTTNFMINVSEISPWWSGLIGSSAEATIENTLKRSIERLIIAISTIALLVMTIGAGYIILYAGEDERLTRGKTIFTGWLIAVGVSLLSWIMVQLVSYLLYI